MALHKSLIYQLSTPYRPIELPVANSIYREHKLDITRYIGPASINDEKD